MRFPGQYEDSETGLHYNRYRYYDPDAAQFTTADPIGLLGGLNLYGYAANPVGTIDPLGLKRQCQINQPCNPCIGRDPATEARKWQGGAQNFPYTGSDAYTNVVVKKGTILYSLYPHGNQPGNFHVTSGDVIATRTARAYNDRLQVAHRGNWSSQNARPMRTRVRAHVLKEDTCMAVGVTLNNPHLGSGGGIQYFIENQDKGKLVSLPHVIGFKK